MTALDCTQQRLLGGTVPSQSAWKSRSAIVDFGAGQPDVACQLFAVTPLRPANGCPRVQTIA
jgi:hypothetical protein